MLPDRIDIRSSRGDSWRIPRAVEPWCGSKTGFEEKEGWGARTFANIELRPLGADKAGIDPAPIGGDLYEKFSSARGVVGVEGNPEDRPTFYNDCVGI